MIQNNASRLRHEKSKRDYVTPLWKEFHWLPVKHHVYITSSQRSLWSQWQAFGGCACSLTHHCTVSCSILVSYVRCSALGVALGLCGYVPGVASMCVSFLAVELTLSWRHSPTTLRFCWVFHVQWHLPATGQPSVLYVCYRLVLCQVCVQCFCWPDYRWGGLFSPSRVLLSFALSVLQPFCCILQLTNTIFSQTCGGPAPKCFQRGSHMWSNCPKAYKVSSNVLKEIVKLT